MRRCWLILAFLASLNGFARAAEEAAALPSYPVPLPTLETTATTHEPDTASQFGKPGTSHWLMVLMPCYAPAADEVVYAFDLERNYYFLQNTSINLHLQGFYFDQPGPNAWAYGPALTIRHSFHVRERSRFFLMGGIGAIYSDNTIPEVIGSRFNFAPRASVGYVYSFNEQTSLVTGLRVSHIDSLIEPGYSRTVLQYFLGLSIVLK